MRSRLPLLFLVLALLSARPVAQVPVTPVSDLADSSAVVALGRVMSTAVQAEAGSIYTYASIDVAEVLKGRLAERTVVLKQLGGTLPDIGLYISDQATFTPGEDVLVFLAVRPRDGTLYTAGLSRGKWTVLPDLQSGGRTAANGDALVPIDDALRASVAASRAHADAFVATPPEAGQLSAPSFTYIPSSEGGPARWHEADDGFHIPVDFQTIPGGLPGGGSNQLDAALGAWNGVNTRLRLDRAATGPHTCPARNFTGNGRIALYWNDPCAEISDSDATVFGVGGGFFTPGLQKTINGVTFNAFIQGIAILNNSGPHLQSAACLQDALTHVLGHAVGLGHSADSNAVMFATLRSGCSSGSTGIGTDDSNGLRSIYPAIASGGSAPSAPTAITHSVALDTVSLSWTPATTGGPADSYVLEAGSGPGLANIATFVLNSPNTSTVVNAVPSGVYYVRVRARNVLGTSGPSPDTVVTVGPCEAPAAPTSMAYTTADNLVTITWTPPATGVTQGYVLSAGFAPGDSSALVLPLGPTPLFQGVAPFGTYFVRVAARNSCAVGPATSPDLQVNVVPCTAVPGAPTGLAHTRTGNIVTLSWNAPAAPNLPSRYVIVVGPGPGLGNLLAVRTTSNATSFQATAPAGTYYVRVFSENNCGSSATASNEEVVVVP
jgi:Matrixin